MSRSSRAPLPFAAIALGVALVAGACGSPAATSSARDRELNSPRLGVRRRDARGHGRRLLRPERGARRADHRALRAGVRRGRRGPLRGHVASSPRRSSRRVTTAPRTCSSARTAARSARSARRAGSRRCRRTCSTRSIPASAPMPATGSASPAGPASSPTTRASSRPRRTCRPRSRTSPNPEWKGRVGWVPTNASFQTFVTALRQSLGDEATKAWLEAMVANEPKVYEGNAAALEAVRAGEVDVALINHYYLFQAQQEAGEDYPVANHFFANGDPGALVNVAGVGILETADHPAAAEALARFLLDEEAQTYFATETFEYPLRDGIAADDRLPALAEVAVARPRPVGARRPRGHAPAAPGGRRPLGGRLPRLGPRPAAEAPPPPPTPAAAAGRGGRRRAARDHADRVPRDPRDRRRRRFAGPRVPGAHGAGGGQHARHGAARGRGLGRDRAAARLADRADRPAVPARVRGARRRAAGRAVVRARVRGHRDVRADGDARDAARTARGRDPARDLRAARRGVRPDPRHVPVRHARGAGRGRPPRPGAPRRRADAGRRRPARVPPRRPADPRPARRRGRPARDPVRAGRLRLGVPAAVRLPLARDLRPVPRDLRPVARRGPGADPRVPRPCGHPRRGVGAVTPPACRRALPGTPDADRRSSVAGAGRRSSSASPSWASPSSCRSRRSSRGSSRGSRTASRSGSCRALRGTR